jgi:hypothetical protein
MQHSAPAAANLLATSGDDLPILRFAHHPALETCDSDNEICLHALYLLQTILSSSCYDDLTKMTLTMTFVTIEESIGKSGNTYCGT